MIDRFKRKTGTINITQVAAHRGEVALAVYESLQTQVLELFGVTILDFQINDVRLYGVIFVKGVPQGSYPFSPSSVSLFDLAARFFVPTHDREEPARAEAVKDGA